MSFKEHRIATEGDCKKKIRYRMENCITVVRDSKVDKSSLGYCRCSTGEMASRVCDDKLISPNLSRAGPISPSRPDEHERLKSGGKNWSD